MVSKIIPTCRPGGPRQQTCTGYPTCARQGSPPKSPVAVPAPSVLPSCPGLRSRSMTLGSARFGSGASDQPQERGESRFLLPKGQNASVSEESRSSKSPFSLPSFSAKNEEGKNRSARLSADEVNEISGEPGSKNVLVLKKSESSGKENRSSEGLKPDPKGIERAGFSHMNKVANREIYILGGVLRIC